jgi:hypothetical protein
MTTAVTDTRSMHRNSTERSSHSYRKSYQSSLREEKRMARRKLRPRSRRGSTVEAEWSSASFSDQPNPNITSLCTIQPPEIPWKVMGMRHKGGHTDFQHTRTRFTSVADPMHEAESSVDGVLVCKSERGCALKQSSFRTFVVACVVGIMLTTQATVCSAFSPTCCAGRLRPSVAWPNPVLPSWSPKSLVEDTLLQQTKSKAAVFMNLCQSAYAEGIVERDRPHIFLRGLPAGLDEEGLKRLLMPFGEVTWAKLVLDVNTGISKCNAFARFRGWDMALKALSSLDGTEVCAIGDDDVGNSCSIVHVEAASDKSQGVMSERLCSKLEDIRRQIELEKRQEMYDDEQSQHALTFVRREDFGGSVMRLFHSENEKDSSTRITTVSSPLLLSHVTPKTEMTTTLVRAGVLRKQKKAAQKGQVYIEKEEGTYQQHSLLSRRLVGRVGLVSCVGESFCIVNQDIFCPKDLLPKDKALKVGDLVSVDANWRVRGRSRWLATKLVLPDTEEESFTTGQHIKSAADWGQAETWQESSSGAHSYDEYVVKQAEIVDGR